MSRYRELKIHSKLRTRRWDNTTVPEIRLEGKWLEEWGYEEGVQVKIEQQHNKLTITPHKEEEGKCLETGACN